MPCTVGIVRPTPEFVVRPRENTDERERHSVCRQPIIQFSDSMNAISAWVCSADGDGFRFNASLQAAASGSVSE